jgi:hypothetical protein
MNTRYKYIFAIVVMGLAVVSCDLIETITKKTGLGKDTVKVGKDQYIIAEEYKGSQDQIIDLIKGEAVFTIVHKDEGEFKANLKKPDGKLIVVLADVTGEYSGKKSVTITETGPYIVEVITKGRWSIYRE